MKRRLRRSSRTGRRPRLYGTGELNRLIDAPLHPIARHDPNFMILDRALHSLVEQHPPRSFVKFLRYNASILLDQLIRKQKRGKPS